MHLRSGAWRDRQRISCDETTLYGAENCACDNFATAPVILALGDMPEAVGIGAPARHHAGSITQTASLMPTGLPAIAMWLVGGAILPLIADQAFGQSTSSAMEANAPTTVPPRVTLLAPGMNGVLAFPSDPYALTMGALGKWYVDAAVTGLGLMQGNRVPGDRGTLLDLSNGQVFLQKVDGWWQFYVQAGAYAIPALGTAYAPYDSIHASGNTYDAVPQAFLKLAPFDNLSLEAGKLPTLIGPESTFTYENINIERGLLWNQEPAVSRGAQGSYTIGPVAINVSLNDGFYTNRYNWLSGSVIWSASPHDTVSFDAGGNLGHPSDQETSYATPAAQNSGAIYNLIYTYNDSPFIVTPYVQYSNVPRNPQLGILRNTASYAGALLISYAINATVSLAGRGEYIRTNGNARDGAANLLYGPGSSAFSLTVTPAFVFDRFYVRAELSYVHVSGLLPGDSFASGGSAADQVRALLEGGILF